MPSDEQRLKQAFQHILRIKEGTYPVMDNQSIAERPWAEVPERSKLAILQDAVNWEGVTNRDQAHILLSEIDPGKVSDAQRNNLIEAAIEEKSRESGGRER